MLTTASALGTLAAARCLGEKGVPLILVDAERFTPVAWSRYVVRREASPKVRPVARFVDALAAFGDRHPGHVLYPTSDDLAWTLAEREPVLRRSFRLLTPPFPSLVRVLDKRELYAACADVGVAVPETWFPERDADLERVAAAARFPVIIKPRAQVFFTSARKGVIVRSPLELASRYRDFLLANRYEAAIADERPHMARPMIQELHPGEPVYSVSGFCVPRRNLFVARGARKVLQWPRQAGVGIAFADAPLDAALAEGVRRLCSATGFFGVFEAEFVATGAGMRLIDFNPRLFNQVGFDVARGLPSPYFAYLLALGDTARLDAAVEEARAWRSDGRATYEYGSMIAWTRVAERLAGRRAGRTESHTNAGNAAIVEAVMDGEDWLPGLVDHLRQLGTALVHPRSTLRAAARGYG